MIENVLAAYVGLDAESVREIAERAPYLYRRYSVKKKRGGYREIYHPAKKTKTLQSAAIDLIHDQRLLHECVTGYVRGLRSPLVENAKRHAQNTFLLKLDFCAFFPSIKANDFRSVLAKQLHLHGTLLSDGELEWLARLFFVHNRVRNDWFLGIGAPSSPFVSNWVMYRLDTRISQAASELSCNYTRYADDMCFSANSKESLLELERRVEHLVSECANPSLSLNDSKRRLASKFTKRYITGLTITPAGEVKVPRSFKRRIRAMMCEHIHQKLNEREIMVLRGNLAFLNDCEPGYLINLAMKYGAKAMRDVLHSDL